MCWLLKSDRNADDKMALLACAARVGQDVMYAVAYTAVFPHIYLLLDHFLLAPWRKRRKWRGEATNFTQMDCITTNEERLVGVCYQVSAR